MASSKRGVDCREPAMGEAVSRRLRTEAQNEERCFVNRYSDYEPSTSYSDLFDSSGTIDESFAKRLKIKIKDLQQQMEEGLTTADPHDSSVYTGWAGIGLLYLRLHTMHKDAADLRHAVEISQRSLRSLRARRFSFLCGDAGPLALGAVTFLAVGELEESQSCVNKLLQLQPAVMRLDSDLPDELLYGRAGYLYALLFVQAKLGPDAVPKDKIIEVSNAMLDSGQALARAERRSDRSPLMYAWHGKQYLGAAHGLAGIYYMLMQPGAGVSEESLTELVRPSLDYLRHRRMRSGNFPSSLGNDTDRLVHWCHGAPGVIHALLLACTVFKEEKYLREAVECGDLIWQRGLLHKGYGLCHGTAGNGYVFLALYRATGDHRHLYRACKAWQEPSTSCWTCSIQTQQSSQPLNSESFPVSSATLFHSL
uniref:lanC-like protein 2 isoform X2 n=1 Tax=Myxine glutinosa TaxID=7769 RepID=UPI00358EE1EE